jgi:hypothetical protein
VVGDQEDRWRGSLNATTLSGTFADRCGRGSAILLGRDRVSVMAGWFMQ